MNPPRIIVVGAGMAGLLLAAALAPHAREVVLLDRDALPERPDHRPGVPQSPHSHVLLARGRALFEALLPGLDAELALRAPEEVDWTGDCVVFSSAGRVPRFASPLVTRPCTRPVLEWSVRRRVLALPNVEVRAATKVAELAAAAGRVTGVALENGEVLAADLVIDASGRGSRAPRWLVALGYAAPAEQSVDAHLGYATRTFRRPDGARDWKGLLISTTPPDNPRAAALWPVEDGQWLVTLSGTAGHHPPTDEAGFLAFAKALPTPLLHDAIVDAVPTGPIHAYRKTGNRWRRYDRLTRMPEGFLVAGDAVCAFNPIYGQGMTVAALEARLLAGLLAARSAGPGLDGIWRAWHRALPGAIEPAWLLATAEDARWPTTEGGDRGLVASISNWYVDRLMELTPRSPAMVEAFLSVVHMTRPPSALVGPAIAPRVLWHAVFG